MGDPVRRRRSTLTTSASRSPAAPGATLAPRGRGHRSAASADDCTSNERLPSGEPAEATSVVPETAVVGGVFILQAARMAGTNTAAIRMWEKHGLIRPARTSSGYRLYSMQDVSRLRELKRLSQDGVNPAGMLRILEEREPAAVTAAPGNRQSLHGAGRRARNVSDILRDLRRQKGMTLREVAVATGLSASFVSSVERGLAMPSLPSLQKLAAAFNTSVQGLMTDVATEPDEVLVRARKRRVFENGGGVTIEDLSAPQSGLESLLFTVQPGAGSDGAFAHEGEEFLYMVSGTLALTLDGSLDFDLGPGDAMSYDSMRPHQWINGGSEPTVIIWVNTPRTF